MKGSDIVISFVIQQLLRHGYAGRGDFRNLTFYNFTSGFFRFFGILSLITNSNFVSFFNQFGQVIIQCMIGEAGKGRLVASIISFGEGNAQFFANQLCIIGKGLIKIPNPKKKYGSRVFVFNLKILPHQRSLLFLSTHALEIPVFMLIDC